MTKLNSIVFALFWCITLTFFGQSKVDIGIEGGPSLIFMRGNDIDLHPPTIGFSGGVSVQFNFGKTVSFRTGLSYERKGAAIRNYNTTYMPSDRVRYAHYYDYLVVPLLVRASFGEKVRFFVNAGPYLGYLLRNFSVIKDHSSKNIYNGSIDQKLDLGIAAGLGTFIPFGEKLALTLELRHNLGLYNISSYPNYTLKTFSSNFLIGFAYRIGT